MKKKQIFSLLVIIMVAGMLFSGCRPEENKGVASYENAEPPTTEIKVSIDLYPADIRFTEYTELKLSDNSQIPLDGQVQPDESESGQPDENESIQPDEDESAQPDESESIQPDESESIQPDEDESAQPDESESDESTTQPTGAVGTAVLTEDNIITVFRFQTNKTDMANGSSIRYYYIQVQIQEDENTTILTGTLWPDGNVNWDSWENLQMNGEENAEDVRPKLEESLKEVKDGEWISCIEAGVYAHNQNLTESWVFDRDVIYTDAGHTTFQIQSYDEKGSLYRVMELSPNDDVKVLLDGSIKQVQWQEEQYPVMSLTVQSEPEPEPEPEPEKTPIGFYVAVILLAVSNLICLAYILYRKNGRNRGFYKSEKSERARGTAGKVKSIGTVHNIGSRDGQQDSFDVIECAAGTLAVVADGMGGLTDGDKVSQRIVATMRLDALRIRPDQTDNVLCQMTAHVNQEINRMLGTARQYKCGSTLLAVLIENHMMQWITVGDSRIYLYRGGSLIQINREHIYCTELLEKAINGKISFAEAIRDPQAERLSSFIGMGELKRVDICQNKLKLCDGDRILLMSDGVFNTLSNEEIADIIQSTPDASVAAVYLEQKVLQKNAPKQDNFTCVILEI